MKQCAPFRLVFRAWDPNDRRENKNRKFPNPLSIRQLSIVALSLTRWLLGKNKTKARQYHSAVHWTSSMCKFILKNKSKWIFQQWVRGGKSKILQRSIHQPYAQLHYLPELINFPVADNGPPLLSLRFTVPNSWFGATDFFASFHGQT